MTAGCGLCPDQTGRLAELTAGPSWWAQWGIGILTGYAVPGWLALFPRRHLGSAEEFSDDEAGQLGPALRQITASVQAVCECDKVYTVAFGEWIPHWHLLVMAIPHDLAPGDRGSAALAARHRLLDETAARSVAEAVAATFGAG